MNDFGGDYRDMARAYYGPTVPDWEWEERMRARNARLTDALEAVLSALEDVGMEHSYIHEIASKALEGK